MKEVADTLATDDYMYWHSCTMQEAQEAADNGTAAIGVSEERIVLLAATDEEQPVAATAAVMTLDENTSAYAMDGMRYYVYGGGSTSDTTTTNPSPTIEYGCGGAYRQVSTSEPNCLGYALFLDESPSINPLWGWSHETEDFFR